MIESIDNYIQLALLGVCAALSLNRAIVTRRRSWVLVTLFYSAFFMGSLYWQLYFLYMGVTPGIFYVAELSWYISFLFLFLFMKYERESKAESPRCLIKWLAVLFAGALSIYFMTFGQIISNIISAVLMSLIGIGAVQGLCDIKAGTGIRSRRMLPVFVLALVFFFLEHALWISSCAWHGDYTVLNPYYYIDITISITLFVMFFYIKKALQKDAAEVKST